MVDKKAAADIGARVDVDARLRMGHLGDDARHQRRAQCIQGMRQAVMDDGQDARIAQQHFIDAVRGRVAMESGRHVRVELGADAELTVYRVVQESLTNISKYAHATEVTVTLHAYEHHVELDIMDNGQGFDVADRINASHGFAGMRHRVEALRGTLAVSSEVGRGSHIRAVLPKATAALATTVEAAEAD